MQNFDCSPLDSVTRATWQWYLVHCQRLEERFAARALADNLRLIFYLPEVCRHIRGQLRRVAFFPGYLFVQANLHEVELKDINTMPGVVRLVAFGDGPESVPAEVIEFIRQKVKVFNAAGGLTEHGFRSGDAVRLKDEPMRGLEAIFLGPMKSSERVRVLIEFLGDLRETEVKADMLERAGVGPALRRGRRTRGHGRFIKPR